MGEHIPFPSGPRSCTQEDADDVFYEMFCKDSFKRISQLYLKKKVSKVESKVKIRKGFR